MGFYRLLSRSALACALAFSLSACDSNDDEDDDGGARGSATGTISGDVSGSFDANAYFFVEDGDFGFVFYDGAPEGFEQDDEYLFLVRDNASRPGTGEYDISAEAAGSDFIALYKGVGDPDGVTTRIVVGESGEVDITSSSDDRIRGTYSFSGVTISGTDVGSVQISGTFDARRADADEFPEVPDGLVGLDASDD